MATTKTRGTPSNTKMATVNDGEGANAVMQSATEYAFEDLEQAIVELGDAVSTLNMRLHPVVSPTCAGSVDNDSNKILSRGASPIVERLQNLRCDVNSIHSCITSAIAALEI